MKNRLSLFFLLVILTFVFGCGKTERNFYSNGKLRSKIEYNFSGKRDGKCIYWYPNGKIKQKKSFIDGKLDRLETNWYKNGNVYSKHFLKKGVLQKFEYWFKNANRQRLSPPVFFVLISAV